MDLISETVSEIAKERLKVEVVRITLPPRKLTFEWIARVQKFLLRLCGKHPLRQGHQKRSAKSFAFAPESLHLYGQRKSRISFHVLEDGNTIFLSSNQTDLAIYGCTAMEQLGDTAMG